MGRHSQKRSGLGAIVPVARTVAATGSHGRRRAEGPVRTSVSPIMYRAGGVAAALSLAVSGGAYAAVQVGAGDVAPLGATASLASHGLEAANRSTERTAVDGAAYTLVVDGATTDELTDESTWGAALAAAGVSVDTTQGDTVSVSLGDAPKAGTTVSVDHAAVTQATVDETQAHGTIEKQSDALYEGETTVETEGVDGQVRTTYNVTTVNGEEASRTAVSTVVITPKVDKVVLVGTKAKTSDAATSATAAAAATATGGTTAGDAQAVARAMMGGYGWGDGEFSCLVSLWNRESGWNYQAQNSSSGAYGIPQALPGSKMVSAGSDWATNPATQISWGLGYISGRYGTPCSAWAHSESVGWY